MTVNGHPPLILASSSPYRKALLARLGLTFTSLSPNIDEKPHPQENPAQLARRLARQKAEAIAQQHPEAIIIGSDQLAVHQSHILGKAGSPAAAAAQLSRLSGANVEFLTSVCVLAPKTPAIQEHTDHTRVHFRPLSPEEITAYLQKDHAWDCTGSFKVESLGVCLFERIENQDPTALQGLPLIRLCHFLRQLGVSPLMNETS